MCRTSSSCSSTAEVIPGAPFFTSKTHRSPVSSGHGRRPLRQHPGPGPHQSDASGRRRPRGPRGARNLLPAPGGRVAHPSHRCQVPSRGQHLSRGARTQGWDDVALGTPGSRSPRRHPDPSRAALDRGSRTAVVRRVRRVLPGRPARRPTRGPACGRDLRHLCLQRAGAVLVGLQPAVRSFVGATWAPRVRGSDAGACGEVRCPSHRPARSPAPPGAAQHRVPPPGVPAGGRDL